MKRSIIILLVALPIALAARTSHAECGGSGSGGSDSSSGGSDIDSDSEPACVNSTPVVGYAECRRFGDWDASRRPPISFTVGTSFHRLSSGSIDVSAAANHPEMTDAAAFRVMSESSNKTLNGGSFDAQLLFALGSIAYVGIEGHIGSLSASSLTAESSTNQLTATPTSVTYAGAAAVGGVRMPVGLWDIKAELSAGLEALAVHTHTSHADCELDETAADLSASIKPRLRVDRWISPWLTVGAGVGSNLLRRGDMSFTLSIGGHLRAFDGGR